MSCPGGNKGGAGMVASFSKIADDYEAFMNVKRPEFTYVITENEYMIGGIKVRFEADGTVRKEFPDGKRTRADGGSQYIIKSSNEFAIDETILNRTRLNPTKELRDNNINNFLGRKFASNVKNHTQEDISTLTSPNRAVEVRRSLYRKAAQNAGSKVDDTNYKPINYLNAHDKSLMIAMNKRFGMKID